MAPKNHKQHETPPIKALIDQLDSDAAQYALDLERRQIRVPYRNQIVLLVFKTDDDRETKFTVTPRNLSSQGIGFIHCNFINHRTCNMILRDLQGQWHKIPGQIIRCQHGQGLLHHVSARFDQHIPLNQFVTLDPETAAKAQADIDLYNLMFNNIQKQKQHRQAG